jgi:hypothetical protein
MAERSKNQHLAKQPQHNSDQSNTPARNQINTTRKKPRLKPPQQEPTRRQRSIRLNKPLPKHHSPYFQSQSAHAQHQPQNHSPQEKAIKANQFAVPTFLSTIFDGNSSSAYDGKNTASTVV